MSRTTWYRRQREAKRYCGRYTRLLIPAAQPNSGFPTCTRDFSHVNAGEKDVGRLNWIQKIKLKDQSTKKNETKFSPSSRKTDFQ